MEPSDFENGRRQGAEEAERTIAAWVRSQSVEARGVGRKYMAIWLDRVAVAIESGEHRNHGRT